MSTTVLVIVIAVVVIAILVVFVLLGIQRRRKAALRDKFGPEYDRTVRDEGSTKNADTELQARVDSRNELEIRSLSPTDQDRYRQQWRDVQAEFVDVPQASLARADALVERVMIDCGYPMQDFDQQADLVSVDHPEVVNDYRQAHRVFLTNATDRVSVDEARRAFIAYRSLFSQLLGADQAVAQSDARPANRGDKRV